MAGPDFLGIGAQRAGTSWLYTVLERHPALWLPPLKELHYFDDPLSLNKQRYYSFLRTRIISGLWVRRPLSAWDFHYFFGKRSDEWYRRLFEGAHRRGMVTGEISPSYATLGEEDFLRMRAINPNIKILFIMRDPIMRSWSSIIKSRQKRKLLAPPTAQVAIDHSRGEGVSKKSSYLMTIERIEGIFARNQIFYGFFEDLVANPLSFLQNVCSFLQVESGNIRALMPPAPVGAAAGGRRPPPEFERSLAASFLPDVEKLCARFDGAPQNWRARYEALLSRGDRDDALGGHPTGI